MSLHPLAQLGQVALALGLGAALGLLFDVLRVPRRHARRAFLRAVLDAVFCLAVGLTVFAFGMAAGSGQVRLFMFLAIAAGWTGYFAWVSGQVLPPLEQFSRRCAQKTRQFAAPGQKFAKKVWIFAKKRFQNRRRCFRIDCITGSRYDPGGGSADCEIQKGKHLYNAGHRGADGVRAHQPVCGAPADPAASGSRGDAAAAGVRDDPVQRRAAVSDRPQRGRRHDRPSRATTARRGRARARRRRPTRAIPTRPPEDDEERGVFVPAICPDVSVATLSASPQGEPSGSPTGRVPPGVGRPRSAPGNTGPVMTDLPRRLDAASPRRGGSARSARPSALLVPVPGR